MNILVGGVSLETIVRDRNKLQCEVNRLNKIIAAQAVQLREQGMKIKDKDALRGLRQKVSLIDQPMNPTIW